MKTSTEFFQGFTLIELVVVLFIMMLMITFITLNIDFSANEHEKIKVAGRNLATKIELVQQEASLQQATYRVVIHKHFYAFEKLKLSSGLVVWEKPKNNSILNASKADQNIFFQSSKPVEIYPNGDLSEFMIRIGNEQNTYSTTVMSNNNGDIEILSHDEQK